MINATLIDHMGGDLTTVNSARVSFGKTKETLNDSDTRLINYLGNHGHISPFGHCFASFHVKAPIFVARQLVKHKFLRWNEISRRYVKDKPEFYLPQVWRSQSPDKKQGSGEPLSKQPNIKASMQYALETYQNLLEDGVCEEQARMVLPQNTMTEWYWSGSLDAFASMCNLRCKPDTQQETRVLADQIDKIMIGLFPHSWESLRT